MPGDGSVAAALHLPPPPPPPHELPLPLQPPPLQPDELEPPLQPPLHPDELEPLLQPPPPPPLPLLQLPPDELEPLLQPPPPPLLLDEHALQVPPQPPWSLEREQALSQDSALLQLGPEQSQLGDAVQFSFLFEHESLQLTFVDRGGSVGGAVPPSTSPGNGCDGGP